MNKLNFPWLVQMAWRDSRRNRSRLFLFISSIILGIAALVAIFSFGYNLREDIDDQAKEMIGADLVITSNRPVNPSMLPLLDSLGNRRSKERSFASMILFPKNQGTRLVQIRALEGQFPYYGALETSPASAAQTFRNGQQAIVDKTLMLQFDARVGDSIKVGEVTFQIAGILNKAPGQTGISATVAPAVYIPLRYLPQTGLEQKGSRINYLYYYKYDTPVDTKKLVEKLEPRLEKEALNTETIETQRDEMGRSFRDLTSFLALVGFIALLLGSIGVASAIHVYIREKLRSIAILRCLGVSATQAFLIYVIQILGIGLLGSIIGAILGTVVQQVLPQVLQDLLPIEITVGISWLAILQGIGLGLIISLLFSLLPLVSIRNVSPLNTLRISLESTSLFRDPLKWLVYGLILLFIFGFTYLQTEKWKEAGYFTLGVLVGFLVLAGIAWVLMWTVRRFFPESLSYVWRQGLANLFRPNNQTLILIVSIGLGTAFISTLYFVQGILLNQVTLSASENQPNMVLFDIQGGQRVAVANLTRQQGLPVIDEVPIVTMRIEEINGLTAEQVKEDSTSGISPRAFQREIRSTFRSTITDSEKVIDGTWRGKVASQTDTVYISLDDRYAEWIKVEVGDKIVFNVQGALIPTVVGSLREVDWNRIQTNFRVVFPVGVLEAAPQFHVLMTKVPTAEASAKFQQAVVRQFPNVSIIDLELILSVMDELLDKIGFVIRFMAAFSIITGLVVLISSVLISKYQRMQESVLLRTLGANRNQIFAITALEYFFLGALAAGTGIVLSLAGSWALAKYSFETVFTPQLWPVLLLFLMISGLTVLIGLFNSRAVVSQSPLEVLRSEG
ncbi:ABC transporter permease [Rufibacter tibetensis]|uniref:ABC transporter permease n=1 Tax=Rufibacter tibetensis TaxID=512763 RepID=A0A0P0CSJ4_9BACT|nr:FtsX-like permease family protein [Rufibacter tibetensis]ALJ00428.1 ABC transporter permease [Rufibacter tibetensis]